ncbi:zinc-dependent alcohol dehydrogenase [Deinococcus yavapaiensis]|uniref:Threonine dehydrogenase-like Zn-dependent dehydrogenase n=1 Tax=Deinococcus yavapaiensis KR-236 TaxID=694435 RepID=A0A318SHV0_9DEIO|nr:zinc-dependent alcohol dehydrogenase [Deinococcus yavapaiensis]PYE53546.1 threonine dehydrogenase-like Zn-dependent dehydrogenase [Deinococcus yavapaiensis KR-236]
MKAVVWNRITDVRVEEVPDAKILQQSDVVIKMTAATICGSDLHLYDGYVPSMTPGDIIGHEFMGEVVEVGPDVTKFKVGDRVIVPSVIACGQCWYCQHGRFSLCDNTNPNAKIAEAMYGYSGAAIFGYSHAFGGYAGGFAEYVRVPYADVGPILVPDSLTDEQALFVSDAFPTGWQAAYFADIKPGDVVAVWGAGAVGLFAIASAFMMGADDVIAIDRFSDRLDKARQLGARTINYEEINQQGVTIVSALKEMTAGRGPDRAIDAVGMEAHGTGFGANIDRVKQATRLAELDRPYVLRQAIQAVRKGGTVSISGVYAGLVDKMPLGAIVNKSLHLRGGQMHAQRYLKDLVKRVENGEIDPSFVVTHRLSLEDAPQAFETFKKKHGPNEHGEDCPCCRVVLKPHLKKIESKQGPGKPVEVNA